MLNKPLQEQSKEVSVLFVLFESFRLFRPCEWATGSSAQVGCNAAGVTVATVDLFAQATCPWKQKKTRDRWVAELAHCYPNQVTEKSMVGSNVYGNS